MQYAYKNNLYYLIVISYVQTNLVNCLVSEIGVLIISRSYVPAWKCNATNQDLNTHYGNHGTRINDIFKPSSSDAYAFILDNRFPSIGDSETKRVDVTLVHTWQQEIRESQLKDR